VVNKEVWLNELVEVIRGRLMRLQIHFDGKILANAVTRNVGVELGNIVFRLFIWQDMIEEIIQKKAYIQGINFGQPQRSKKIEITNWAQDEWERDGWITPHNSFLHYYYRGGIVGLAFFITLIILIIRAIKKVLRFKSISGVLLLSTIIYWCGISFFLVILELPQYAIPFWCLFGLTMAYVESLNTLTE